MGEYRGRRNYSGRKTRRKMRVGRKRRKGKKRKRRQKDNIGHVSEMPSSWYGNLDDVSSGLDGGGALIQTRWTPAAARHSRQSQLMS